MVLVLIEIILYFEFYCDTHNLSAEPLRKKFNTNRYTKRGILSVD